MVYIDKALANQSTVFALIEEKRNIQLAWKELEGTKWTMEGTMERLPLEGLHSLPM